MKKIISALLAATMLFSLCTFNVFAGGEGTGTEKPLFYAELEPKAATVTPDLTTTVPADTTFYVHVKWKNNPTDWEKGWSQGAIWVTFDNTKIKVTGSSVTDSTIIMGMPNEEDEEIMDRVSGSAKISKSSAGTATTNGAFGFTMAFEQPLVQDESGYVGKLTCKTLAQVDATDIVVYAEDMYSAHIDEDNHYVLTEDYIETEGSTVVLGNQPVSHTHSMTHTEAKVPTEDDNEGIIENWYCDGCQKYFSDAEGKNEITTGVTYKYDFTNYAEDILALTDTSYAGETLTVEIPDVSTIQRDSEDETAVEYFWSVWLLENGRWVKMEKDTELDTFTAEYDAPDGIYKTYIHCVDANGVSLIEKYDTVVDNTKITMGCPVITGIILNGELMDGTAYVDSSVVGLLTFTVEGANLDKVNILVNDIPYPMDEVNDTFVYSVPTENGVHSYSFFVNEEEKAAKTVRVNVYNPAAVATYATVDSISTSAAAGKVKVSVAGVSNASKVNYNLSTPYTGASVKNKTTEAKSFTFDLGDNYGYFYARAIAVNGNSDDMVRTMILNARPGGKWSWNTATLNGNASTKASVAAGENIVLNYSAAFSGSLGGEDVQYRVLKNTFDGYAVLKDWSTDTSYEYAFPNPGKYELIVLAKGSDAGSYELNKTFEVEVAGSDFTNDLSVEVAATANVGKPVKIVAASSDNDALYRFTVTRPFGGENLTSYTANSTATWVPNKAGTYTIRVEALGANSFGISDAVVTKTVTVQ